MRNRLSGSLLLLCLLLALLPVAAASGQQAQDAAAGASLILTGKVEAHESVTIAAPFGGMVDDFTLTAGDRVRAGDTLFTISPMKIYAPTDGAAGGVFAQPGDLAAYVQSQYGALCYIEQADGLSITTTTTTGQSGGRDVQLTLGQPVYLTAGTLGREGEGRITARTGDQFTVEILTGNIEERDTVHIYDDPGLAAGARSGRGTAMRTAPIPVTGDGSVLRVHVKEGDPIARGDLLFEMATGMLEGMRPPEDLTVRAPEDGIIAQIIAAAGQSALKDQAMAILYPLDTLTLVATINETDLHMVAAGDAVRLSFDALPGASYEGTVDSIGSIGQASMDGYTQYPVRIDFTPDDGVRLGMSGAAYWD